MNAQSTLTGRIICISTPTVGKSDMFFLEKLMAAAERAAVTTKDLTVALDFAALEMRVLAQMTVPEIPQPTQYRLLSDEPWRRQGKRRGKRK